MVIGVKRRHGSRHRLQKFIEVGVQVERAARAFITARSQLACQHCLPTSPPQRRWYGGTTIAVLTRPNTGRAWSLSARDCSNAVVLWSLSAREVMLPSHGLSLLSAIAPQYCKAAAAVWFQLQSELFQLQTDFQLHNYSCAFICDSVNFVATKTPRN